MIEVRPAAARFETVQPGITTRHCFSSGGHYDPDNAAFGPLIAVDEHVVAPGAGFGRHRHRGVEIVSWVLAGTLRHEDSSSARVELIGPGTLQYQSTGSGIEHAERNASDTEPLRFAQIVLLGGVATPGYLLGKPPLSVGEGDFAVHHPVEPIELAAAAYLHLFITWGSVRAGGHSLRGGDSARVRDEPLIVEGDGEILVWAAPSASGTKVGG